MAATGKITLDIKDYEAKLKQIDKLTAQVASNSKKNFNSAGNADKGLSKLQGGFSKAGSIASALGSQIGGAFGAIGNVIGSIAAGPIAIFTAAIGAAIAIGTKLFDMFTESADEYAEKMAYASQEAQRHADQVQKEDQAAAGYIARLQEIANAESVGNSAKIETLQLLDNLQSQYGDLGAVIDETTGKITNMAEVERRLNEARNNKKAGANYDTSEAYMREAKSAYMKVKGAEWFTTEKGAGKMFDQMRKKKSPEQLLREMEKLAAESNDADEIKGYQAVADKLRAAIKAKNKGDSVKNTGYESTEEYQKAMAEKSQAVSQAQAKNDNIDRSAARRKADNELSFIKYSDEKIKNRQGLIDEAKKRQSTIKSEVDSAQRDVDTAQTAEQKLDAQKRLLEAQARYKQSEAEIGDLEQQVKQIQFQQAEAKKKLFENAQHELQYNQMIIDGEYEKAAALKLEKELKDQNLKLTEEEKQKVLEQRKALEKQGTQKQINDAKDEVALNQLLVDGNFDAYEAEKLRLEMKRQGKQLTEEETAAILEQRKALQKQGTQKMINDLNDEVNLNQLLIDGQYDLYEAEKLRLEMKRQGKQLTKEETEEILKQRKALASQKLQSSQKKEMESLYDKALRAMGKSKEADIAAALKAARDTKGADLTKDEEDRTKKLLDLQNQLSEATASTKIEGGKILTNSLTARGGFAGGAVMPGKENINKQIDSKVEKIKEIMDQIKSLQNEIKTTVEKGLKV